MSVWQFRLSLITLLSEFRKSLNCPEVWESLPVWVILGPLERAQARLMLPLAQAACLSGAWLSQKIFYIWKVGEMILRIKIYKYINTFVFMKNSIKNTHFILELYREEEPLLRDEAVDFCADNDTFHVSMTRSQDGRDCHQWCSSLESEEECSGSCHAITGI